MQLELSIVAVQLIALYCLGAAYQLDYRIEASALQIEQYFTQTHTDTFACTRTHTCMYMHVTR